MQSTGNLQDPYLNELYRHTKPSTAYRQSIESPVYRLSEAMFGSLLASYVIGFIGLIASQLVELHQKSGVMNVPLSGIQYTNVLLTGVQYTFISVAFAYLTASLYLTYHAGILTMHLPLSRLGFDFALSLAQPICFGFSMLFPGWFPVLLGVLLLAVCYRQNHGHKELARSFYKYICERQSSGEEKFDRDEVTDEGKAETFREDFATLLEDKKKYKELSGWRPVSIRVKIFSLLIILVGLAIWYLAPGESTIDSWLRENWHLPPDSHWEQLHWEQLSITVESLLVGCFVIWRGHGILRDRATFLYVRKRAATKTKKADKASSKTPVAPTEEEMSQVNQQFIELLDALDKLVPAEEETNQMDQQYMELLGALNNLC